MNPMQSIQMIVAIGDLYPLLGAASWAYSSAIIRKMEYFGTPIQLNFIRTGIGALLFIIHLTLIQSINIVLALPLGVVFLLFLSVFFNVVIGDSSYFASQNRLGAKLATPLVNTYPVFTIIMAVLFLDENVNQKLVIGTIVTLLGIILLSIDKSSEGDDISSIDTRNRIIGLLLSLLAVFCYALGIIYTTLATKGLDPVVANSVRLPVASVILFFLLIMQPINRNSKDATAPADLTEFFDRNKTASLTSKVLILLSGVLGTYISSIFLVLSVQAIGASRTSILFATTPFFSLPIAIYWLKEETGLVTYSGTLLTVIGIWIILV